MIKYSSSRKSSVEAFSVQNDSILVEFKDGKKYLYTYESAGKNVVNDMIKLAFAHKGLNAYINKNNPTYEEKFLFE